MLGCLALFVLAGAVGVGSRHHKRAASQRSVERVRAEVRAVFTYQRELAAIQEVLAESGSSADFRPASSEDLGYLESLGIPASVREFYAMAEPSEEIEVAGARLWPISWLRVENEQAIPGYVIAPRGYPVIGSTEWGDVYCLGLAGTTTEREPAVLLASHDEIDETTAGADIAKGMVRVADSFSEFLRKFAAGELPTDFYAATED